MKENRKECKLAHLSARWQAYPVSLSFVRAVVITGSFNFPKTAKEKNAENLLIIRSEKPAKKYSE